MPRRWQHGLVGQGLQLARSLQARSRQVRFGRRRQQLAAPHVQEGHEREVDDLHNNRQHNSGVSWHEGGLRGA